MPLFHDVLIESLHCLDRRQLDKCRKVGLHWKYIIDSKSTTTLALHRISCFRINWQDYKECDLLRPSCDCYDICYAQSRFSCVILDASATCIFADDGLPKPGIKRRSKKTPTNEAATLLLASFLRNSCVRELSFRCSGLDRGDNEGLEWLSKLLARLENCNVSKICELKNVFFSNDSSALRILETAHGKLGARSFSLLIDLNFFEDHTVNLLWQQNLEQLKICVILCDHDVPNVAWLTALPKLSKCKNFRLAYAMFEGSDGGANFAAFDDIAIRIIKLFQEDSSQLPEQFTLSFMFEFDDDDKILLNVPPGQTLCSYRKEPVLDDAGEDYGHDVDYADEIAAMPKFGRVVHYRHSTSGEYLTLAAEIVELKRYRSVTFYRGRKTLNDIPEAVADPDDKFRSLW